MSIYINKKQVYELNKFLKRENFFLKNTDSYMFKKRGGNIQNIQISGTLNIQSGIFIDGTNIKITKDFYDYDKLIINGASKDIEKNENLIYVQGINEEPSEIFLEFFNNKCQIWFSDKNYIEIGDKKLKNNDFNVYASNFILENEENSLKFNDSGLFLQAENIYIKNGLLADRTGIVYSTETGYLKIDQFKNSTKEFFKQYNIFAIGETGLTVNLEFSTFFNNGSFFYDKIYSTGYDSSFFGLKESQNLDGSFDINLNYSGNENYYFVSTNISGPTKEEYYINHKLVEEKRESSSSSATISSFFKREWSPDDLPDIKLWIDSKNEIFLKVAENNKILEIHDKSGNVNDITQSEEFAPQIITGISFRGNSQYVTGYHEASGKNISLAAVFLLDQKSLNDNSDLNKNTIVLGDESNPLSDFISFPLVGAGSQWGYTGKNFGLSFGGDSERTDSIYIISFDNTGVCYAFINGIYTYFSENRLGIFDKKIKIGAGTGLNLNFKKFDLKELILFNRPLEINETEKLAGYFEHKWDTNKLLSNHPYYDEKPFVNEEIY